MIPEYCLQDVELSAEPPAIMSAPGKQHIRAVAILVATKCESPSTQTSDYGRKPRFLLTCEARKLRTRTGS